MPTSTFFALPAAKRRRILNVCWEEFATVPYESVSINHVVQKARIPRGSFYQYFESKEDLFLYLLAQTPAEFTRLAAQGRQTYPRDTARALAWMLDSISRQAAPPTLPVYRYLQVLRVNPYLDWLQVFSKVSPPGSPTTLADWLTAGVFLAVCKRLLLHPEEGAAMAANHPGVEPLRGETPGQCPGIRPASP